MHPPHPPAAAPAPPASSGPILAVLAFCGIAAALVQTIIVPVLPWLPTLLGISPEAASWLVTSTLLSGAVGTPLLGRLGDMYGKRRMLMISMCLLVTGSLLAVTGGTFAAILVGRILQGASMAVIPLGISIMRDVLPPDRVVAAVGFMSTTLGLGGAVGLPMSALVIEYTNWQTMFVGVALLGLLDLLLISRFVSRSGLRSGGRFDVGGAIGLIVALLCLLIAVSRGQSWGWTSPITLGLFAAAFVFLPFWSLHQLRAVHPLVNLRVSVRRPVLLTNIAAALIGFAMYAGFLATGQLLQAPLSTGYGHGASLVMCGLLMMPSGLAMVVFSPVSARLSNRRGPRFSLLAGASVMAVGYCVYAAAFHQVWQIMVATTLVGAGTALAYSAMPSLIMQSVPETETASANSLNTLMRSVGTSLCSAVVGAVLSSVTMTVGVDILPRGQAFVLVFLLAGTAALSGAFVALRIPR
ncbi:MFS transporter [Streptosporangium sp. NPDC002607]